MVTSCFIASAMVKPSNYNIIPLQSMLYMYVYILRDIASAKKDKAPKDHVAPVAVVAG
jgi:hypothetical protein